MSRRRISVILAAAISAALILAGCGLGADNGSPKKDSVAESPAASTSTTALTEAPDPEPETDESEKYRLPDKVTCLSCVGGEEYIPDIAPIGGGRLLVLNWQYDEEAVTFVRVVDIQEDKVTAETFVSGYADFEAATDCGIVLKYSDKREFCFFDEELDLLKTYKPESLYGKFSPDGGKYYQVICGGLYCEDVESGEITRISLSPQIEPAETIAGISSDGKYIDLRYEKYTDGMYDKTAAIRAELSSGNVEMLTYDAAYPGYSGSYMYSFVFNEGENAQELCRISLDGSECIAFSLDRCDVFNVEGSDHLIYTAESEEGYLQEYLCSLEADGSYAMSLLNYEDPRLYFSGFRYMPQEELIACFCDKEGIVSICLIEPTLFEPEGELEYKESAAPLLFDRQVYEDHLAAGQIPQVPQRLEALRERADRLEEQYGIKIYMSGQCKNMVSEIEYDCTDEYFDSEDEYVYIKAAVDGLERAFSKYPEDLMEQFRYSTGDGGIRICLTSYIHDDFSAAYSVQTGGWYNIVLDVRYSCEMNFYHELWHSTESYINNKDSTLLSEDRWIALDPEGFEYSYEFREDSAGVSEYCYSYDDDWYFYDNYSKTDSLEDKARIMEVVMAPDLFPADDFLSSEHIIAKLECMSDAVRQTFDTSSWGENVFWERYLA